jgi:S1-C subfamily serine protease
VIETNYFPLGSGVLVMKDAKEQHVFIVTAGHVIPPDGDVFFRVAAKNGSDPKHYSSKLATQITGLDWIRSTNADLAVMPMCFDAEEADLQVMGLGENAATYDQVAIGDEVFVAGYPSSVASVSDAAVHIIRNGVVASKSGNAMLLIDAFTFPGNSGGPVFWKPSMGFDVAGVSPKIPARGANLIGIVLAYHPYREQAISAVTGRERIIFESNSGLTDVVSTSRILELLAYPQVQEALARWNRGK